MLIKTEGLVIKEQTVGESDRLITVLTRDKGVLKAFAPRAKSLKNSKNSSTGLLSYSRLTIFTGRDKYIVDDASPIEVFFGLRNDIAALSLAQYFCELAAIFVPENTDSSEQLRLTLNSLSFLAKQKKPIKMIKAITELRMISLAGYMPDLIVCRNCHCYESESWAFFSKKGMIVCMECLEKEQPKEPFMKISQGVLTAMRHIIYSDFIKVYSFTLPNEDIEQLSLATEEYTLNVIGRVPMTLDFYKTIS